MKTLSIMLLAASLSFAQTTKPAMTRQEAIALLNCTEFFTASYVGINAVVPGQVRALNVIMQQSDAKDLLLRLQHEASPEGQLFALCGLYLTDRVTFDQLADEYRQRHGTVQTIAGCIVTEERIPKVLEEIASGLYPNSFVAAAKLAN